MFRVLRVIKTGLGLGMRDTDGRCNRDHLVYLSSRRSRRGWRARGRINKQLGCAGVGAGMGMGMGAGAGAGAGAIQ